MANLKFCPRCNENLIEQHEKYCDKCSSRIEKRRNRTNKYNEGRYKFYSSKAWVKVRELILNRDLHLCRMCLMKNIINYNNIRVHHIVPLEDDTALALILDNLICLCSKCHQRVHIQYDSSEEKKQDMIEILKLIVKEDIKKE